MDGPHAWGTRLMAGAAALALMSLAGCGGARSTPPRSTATSPAQAVAHSLSAVRTPALTAVPSVREAALAMRQLGPAASVRDRAAAARGLRRAGIRLGRSASALRGLPVGPRSIPSGPLAASYSQAAGALDRIARVIAGSAGGLAPARADLARAAARALLWQGAATRVVRAAGGTPPAWLATPHAAMRDLQHAAQAMRLSTGAPTVRGIAELQRRLAALTFLPPGYSTGVDDYRTVQAVIAFQGWENVARDGVAGPQTRRLLARAGRPQPWSTAGRHLEVHIAQQVLLLVSGGRVTRAIHVSTAAPGHVTPTGTFTIYRKERMSWSVPFQVWMPYASYFTGGYALHEYPDVPPYPASHGCIRVPAGDAEVVWSFAAIGTPVIIH